MFKMEKSLNVSRGDAAMFRSFEFLSLDIVSNFGFRYSNLNVPIEPSLLSPFRNFPHTSVLLSVADYYAVKRGSLT